MCWLCISNQSHYCVTNQVVAGRYSVGIGVVLSIDYVYGPRLDFRQLMLDFEIHSRVLLVVLDNKGEKDAMWF